MLRSRTRDALLLEHTSSLKNVGLGEDQWPLCSQVAKEKKKTSRTMCTWTGRIQNWTRTRCTFRWRLRKIRWLFGEEKMSTTYIYMWVTRQCCRKRRQSFWRTAESTSTSCSRWTPRALRWHRLTRGAHKLANWKIRRCQPREAYKGQRDGVVGSDGRVLVRPQQRHEPAAPGELRRPAKLRRSHRNLVNPVRLRL